MDAAIERVLIDRAAIERRVDALAGQLVEDLSRESAGGVPEVTLVPILTGSIIFVSDLIRRLPMPMQIHLISVSSYPGTSTTSQGAQIEASLTDLPASLDGRHILVIDDILDSGKTLSLVKQSLAKRNPASLRICMLLRKQRTQALAFDVDYVGFDIPDQFVVGYGLDHDGYYRNLPDIRTLKNPASEPISDEPRS